MSNHVPEEKKAGEEEGGPMVSSPREAYHIPTSNEPVKIRVAQPYHEYKPEFSRALSSHLRMGCRIVGGLWRFNWNRRPWEISLLSFGQAKKGPALNCAVPVKKNGLVAGKECIGDWKAHQIPHGDTCFHRYQTGGDIIAFPGTEIRGHSRGRNPENGNGKRSRMAGQKQ